VSNPDAQARFCATLIDEWVRAGVAHAVVSPGSRSTPMALALLRDERVAVQVVLDERSAAFTALGVGLATGIPAIVLTTSGTAAVELHPAVVEAHQARVPLLVVTADRPPGSYERGAPQTVDQHRLFGEHTVRWFIDTGETRQLDPSTWRWVGARAVVAATGHPPGPVHLNLPFEEPLVAIDAGVEEGMPDGQVLPVPSNEPPPIGAEERDELDALAEMLLAGDGVLVAGGGVHDPAPVLRLAEALGWPVLADQRSGCRIPHPCVVAHADALLRVASFVAAHRPAMVLRLGAPHASRVLSTWLAATAVAQIGVDPYARIWDPEGSTVATIGLEPGHLATLLLERTADRGAGPSSPWLAAWRAADDAAAAAIDTTLRGAEALSEPAVARTVLATAPEGSSLVVASSMPVRDLEWYAAPRAGVRVFANRGANGIDGVTSTALGVALGSGAPTALLIGDLAFLHDSGALLGLARRPVDLVVVVVDNDGGGIFSFLPQADALEPSAYELLFGTPHGLDLTALAGAHGLSARRVESEGDLVTALTDAHASGGVHVLLVTSDRQQNRAVHDALHAAVADALNAS
jgi:2-succinyl-5-enolpyruvyl-6-hydroxy-3-cyclohexene-1-carboxylate synthase